MRRRAFISTVPFGHSDRTPLDLLERAGIEVVINGRGRRLKQAEVAEAIAGFPVVIAGTESIDAETMARCPDLKAICRVGIGLDGVDLLAARKQGIAVSYTPDGPSAAVAELAVGLIIDLLRGVVRADRELRAGNWSRTLGTRVANATIGVIGVGRIGRRLIQHLTGGFRGVKILANDKAPDPALTDVEWVDKEALFRRSDVITLHVPLSSETRNLITEREIAMMKAEAVLINTARGGIVNESDLARALRDRRLAGAAIDVFREEPYSGELIDLPNAVLTCHMGSMSADCRGRMELEATREAIRFMNGEPLQSPVPDDEYANAESLQRD